MVSLAFQAIRQTLSKPFRRLIILSLLASLALLTGLGIAVQEGIGAIPPLGVAWIDLIIEWVARAFAVIVLVPLVFPVASLVVGIFLENIAAKVEAADYPADPPGADQPFFQSIWIALRFTVTLILVNLLVLPFYLVPILNLGLFWLVNGYLLGREFFELVTLRHLAPGPVRQMRRKNRLRILAAGIIIALFTTVPVVNLLAPVFATIFMVHVYKRSTHATVA